MSNNNGFLSNYGKNSGDIGEPAAEVVVKDIDLGYKYEQKSGFRKPEYEGGGLPPFRRPKLLLPVIVGAAAVIGTIILLVILLNGGVTVIDLKGKTLGDAQLWANQNGVMLTTEEQYNDEFDAGTVIEQDKKSGETVKKGEFLSLTVSKGHDMSITLEVPDLMSMTADEVQAWANANYMSKVIITTEFSDTVPSGKVIRFVVNDNKVIEKVRRDTSIFVIASKGPEDQSAIQVIVPDFKTMSVSEAYIFANENGLILTVEEKYDDYVPKNSVISQSVKAQEKVSKGSEIKLVVSKGKMIEVPDFSDYTKEQASSVAASLGIPVTVVEKYSNSSAGAFLSQSIPAGSVYESGDFLELTYSIGKVTVPSFIGQTLDAIKNWENEADSKGGRITITPSYTNSDHPKGMIIYQDKANTTVSVGTTIYVTVSDGKIIYVPDFVDEDITNGSPDAGRGYDTAITREEAIKMCEAVGLVPVFESAPNSDRLPGEVWFQSIPAGSDTWDNKKITEGTKINLQYVPTQTADAPDFVAENLTEDTAKAAYGNKFTLVFEVNSYYIPGKEGYVVGQSAIAGTTLAMGNTIILYIGPGS